MLYFLKISTNLILWTNSGKKISSVWRESVRKLFLFKLKISIKVMNAK